MKHRAFDLILLVAALIGGFLAWQTGRERSRLEVQYAQLSRKVGDLPITDPSRVHVRALETGDPMHFAWRVYLPPNFNANLRHNAGGSSSAWSSDASELIARIRFREDEQNQLQVYTQFSGGSSRFGLGSPELAELLRGRWDELRVEQLGAPEMAAVAQDRSAVLLRLTMPEDMERNAREKLPAWDLEHQVPVLFEWELNPKTSNP
ncbi:hypothetical protein BH23PLA1_BH23PLA1_08550 [soil metagenome]